MESKNMPRHFIEGIDPPWMRAEIPEIMAGIPHISIKEKRDANLGLYCVDGYYIIKKEDGKNYPLLRMCREYQAKTSDDAVETAKKDGLARGILIEQLGEIVECNLHSFTLPNGKLQELPKNIDLKKLIEDGY
jgi:hypothetical protein